MKTKKTAFCIIHKIPLKEQCWFGKKALYCPECKKNLIQEYKKKWATDNTEEFLQRVARGISTPDEMQKLNIEYYTKMMEERKKLFEKITERRIIIDSPCTETHKKEVK